MKMIVFTKIVNLFDMFGYVNDILFELIFVEINYKSYFIKSTVKIIKLHYQIYANKIKFRYTCQTRVFFFFFNYKNHQLISHQNIVDKH